ncbi:hypothetical protein MTBPR1_180024 [Candidatus Terasakiella magnetica]|uniref:Hemerythrin-like domain-containing protein n=1 Tax=Candidatus Terasakiella magnetica TaxID=1867952 RepID=A0A1C3RFT1_9PROT|nr:hemerythrin family protein [Candidatus Terasakiella magnetica]SCA56111.1 hypothetical protein MTBPR1_180024 [Candidatus Terasakiella magnetica]
MFIVAVLKNSGQKNFEAFWNKQEAATFWSEIISCRKKLEGDVVREVSLYESEATSIEYGVKEARQGRLPALKTHKMLENIPFYEKVKRTGPGVVTPEVIAKAEKEIQAQSARFVDVTKETIAEFKQKVAAMDAAKEVNPADMAQMQDICYNLKAQGGGYSYTLITFAAGHLEKYLNRAAGTETVNERIINILNAYVTTFEFILNNRIKGTGGDLGRALIKKLDQVIKGVEESIDVKAVSEAAKPKPQPKPKATPKPAVEEQKPAAAAPKAAPATPKPAPQAPVEQPKPDPSVISQETLAELFDENKSSSTPKADMPKVDASSFDWSDKYVLGIAEIDEDHRYLFHLIQQFYMATEREASLYEMDYILSILKAYARVHFGREEAILAMCGYDDLLEHTKKHEELLAELDEMRDYYMMSSDQDARENISATFYKWISNHILIHDADYKEAAQAKIEKVSAFLQEFDMPKSWLGDNE